MSYRVSSMPSRPHQIIVTGGSGRLAHLLVRSATSFAASAGLLLQVKAVQVKLFRAAIITTFTSDKGNILLSE